MNTMTPHSIPVFLPGAGIGISRGVFAPQIRAIDVFYTDPIITGFHVVGSPTKCPTVFLDIKSSDENAPRVIGFFGFKSSGPCPQKVVLEEITCLDSVGASMEKPSVIGFHGLVSSETCDQLFLEITGGDENDPKVLGFFAGVTIDTDNSGGKE